MLRQKTGRFYSKGATGNQVVLNVGFEPKIVLFFMNEQSTVGIINDASIAIGAAISNTERFYCFSSQIDGGNGRRRHDDTKCIGVVVPSTGAILEDADFVQFNSDGFELNWVNSDLTSRAIDYIALGGVDLDGVDIKHFLGGNTGNQAITGVGFQPDIVIPIGTTQTVAPPATDNYGCLILGLADGIQNFVNGFNHNGSGSEKRWSRSDGCICAMAASTSAIRALGAVTSLDADGFTINWNPGNTYGYRYFAISLKSSKIKIGSDTFKTSVGDKSYTTGHLTRGVLLFTGQLQDSNYGIDHSYLSIGSCDPDTEFVRFASRSTDTLTKGAKQLNKTDRLISIIHEKDETILNEAAFKSFDVNGFTLDWKTVDGTAWDFHWLSFASEAPVPPPPQPPVIQSINPALPSNLAFQGDPKIILSEKGSDLVFHSGQPVMDCGLENAVLISLFTQKNWCGNTLFPKQGLPIGSRFLESCNQAITISALNDIRNAVIGALSWMRDSLISEIDVKISNPQHDQLKVLIALVPIGQDVKVLQLTKHGLNWQFQRLFAAHERI